jgi:hypothetical protein
MTPEERIKDDMLFIEEKAYELFGISQDDFSSRARAVYINGFLKSSLLRAYERIEQLEKKCSIRNRIARENQ